MTRRDGMATSVGVEAALGKGKEGHNVDWADANLTEPKMKQIHVLQLDGEDLKQRCVNLIFLKIYASEI
jgi:hypothetical protein